MVWGGSGGGSSPMAARRAAELTATANGARLIGSQLDRWPLRVQVEVAVAPSLPWVRRVVEPLRAGATAAVRPHDG